MVSVAQILRTVFSLTLSDFLGIASFALAVQQFLARRTAVKAVRSTKRTLFKHRAAQHFDELCRGAAELAVAVRENKVQAIAEVGTKLAAHLSSATTFCEKLMFDEEKTNLDAGSDALKFILEAIPTDQQPLSAEATKEMLRQCIVVIYGVEKVAGRIKYLQELEDEDDEKLFVRRAKSSGGRLFWSKLRDRVKWSEGRKLLDAEQEAIEEMK